VWNYPNCLGAIDGKHVVFKAPKSMASYYYNYKGTTSIVLLGIVDARYRFLFIDVGCNGRVSDGGVYRNSVFFSQLEKGTLNLPNPTHLSNKSALVPYHFVADDAFPLSNHLMKPFKGKSLSIEERIFNYRLSRARRVSENAFGIMSNRFRVLLRKIELPVETVEKVVLSCCALHNFLINTKFKSYISEVPIVEDTNSLTLESKSLENMPSFIVKSHHKPTVQGKLIREEMKKFFNTDGLVPWQWDAVRKFNF